MFGYVLINKEELKFKEYDVYRSYYCGMCQVLKKRSGNLAQITLNYDMIFLQLLLTSLYEPETKLEVFRCKLHPFKKTIKRTNQITDYIADINLFLAYLKCVDDWKDEKKVSRKLYSFLIGRKINKIRRLYPEKTDKLENILNASREYEAKKEYDIDKIAAYSGELMAEIFLYREDEWREALYKMGFFLGKYIYLIDAYEDVEKDVKKGNYNPFTEIYKNENFDDFVQKILTMMISECAREFENLPIIEDVDILRNILYSGVWSKYKAVRNKREKLEEEEND
ncbi:MAG: DUF5685 family protein [Intestinibacter sp.]|uniref:DUF5685 family protein n=1 Tax=Intestinibacter sp. TaxID=1965304 RepID=UPI0025C64A28|nr:DUF5685 family protein [Intestinibacter sp.]MCI6738957.1 DUF5685 family protein [Intestinibacter sp.]